MKSKCILLIFVLFSVSLSAQNKSSRFFIETGVKIFGGGDDYESYIGKTGISFNKQSWKTYNDDDGSLWQEVSNNNFSWSIAPRIGYRLSNKLKAGIEYQYSHFLWYGDKDINNTLGLFVRFDFNDKRIIPFIEFASGFGREKNDNESTSSGGGQYHDIKKYKLFYLSGSVGVSFVLSDSFNLNLFGRVHNTFRTKIKDNGNDSIYHFTHKYQTLEIGPMLSVTYFFNKKSEEEK